MNRSTISAAIGLTKKGMGLDKTLMQNELSGYIFFLLLLFLLFFVTSPSLGKGDREMSD